MHSKIAKIQELTLLFVEDEDDLVEIISDTLHKLEAKFLTAKNGQEALNVLKDNKIDVVITDINMPIMNGLEMIGKMKELYPSLPIIIMSAHTEIEFMEKAKELGVKDYLVKPFDFIKFIELVSSMDL